MSTTSIGNREQLGTEDSFLPARAARMAESALLFCCHRTSFRTESAVAASLRAGDPRTHDCFRHYLSLQIAEYLTKLDDNLIGVYSYSYGDAEEEGEGRSSSATEALKLILHVRRKTAALGTVVAALDEALLDEYRRLITPAGDRMVSFLDAQTVNDEEAAQGTGIAAILKSTFTPPTRLSPTWR